MNREEKDYISAIYNYCDRWCEKCGFTSNCLLFTQESKIKTHEILHNGDMTGIEEVFSKDIEKMKEEFEDEDDDLSDEELFDYFEDDDEDENLNEYLQRRENPIHPVEELIDEYFIKSNTFLEKLNTRYKFVNASRESLKDPVLLKSLDDVEIVMWYHAFIGAKIKRALFGLNYVKSEDDEELKEIHSFDMNGSAKIGIMSIKRSVDSLNKLHKNLPGYAAEIGEILILLGRILNIVEELFPGCMEFKRPGFDE